jgi:hypothetical protein
MAIFFSLSVLRLSGSFLPVNWQHGASVPCRVLRRWGRCRAGTDLCLV